MGDAGGGTKVEPAVRLLYCWVDGLVGWLVALLFS